MGKRGRFNLIVNVIIIFVIIISYLINNVDYSGYESSRDVSGVPMLIKKEKISLDVRDIQIEYVQYPISNCSYYHKEYSDEEKYMLAKIAMCEAEDQDLQTKKLIIMTILNRVESIDFPDSIREVIFEKVSDKYYQYSPTMPGGRWYEVEPNKECYDAVEEVLLSEYDCSEGALYFESCKETENWHSRNLEYLYQSQGFRFYK